MTIRYTVLLMMILFAPLMALDNWPQFRGPSADGLSTAKNTPVEWSETKNIKWKTPVHDLGWSTPVIWSNQIWLTTATVDGHKFFAVCVDFESGKIIHDILVFTETDPQNISDLNSYATPSPVIEEGRVYVHYGTFGTACINTKTGKILWQRRDLNCNHLQGPASSPFIYNNLLILHIEGTDVQFVVALDKNTGKTIWKTDRPRDVYNDDVRPLYKKAYSTPIVITVNGKKQLISEGAQATFAYVPETGEEIWRVIYGFDSTVSCPISGNGLVYLNTGWDTRKIGLLAVRPDGSGDVTKSHVLWEYWDKVAGESSPIFVNGLIYMVSDGGDLTCLDAAKGEKVWFQKLPGKFGASPVFANGLLYFCNKKGQTTVIKTGKTFNQLAVNQLNEGIWASPVVTGSTLVLRTKTYLYRVEK